MKMLKHCLALTVVASLVGCQATGEQYESDVFDASQVNTQQEAKTVKILTVSPTKIKVSNEKNKNAAMMVGGVLGALGGAALGAGKNTDTAIVGGVAGGGAGALAGSMVNDTTLVPGVLIGYSESGKIYTSAQVGRPCNFEVGGISLMVMTMSNETRIQPNATCPEPKKS
ncbi:MULTISPECIES: hypothetical protein [Pseudomonas]|jgi:outer membrane lipoprotein SlyB|uniref:Glycine zipper 2TM domain-containing protein n=3 Tax=Pseudomonas TaxID=286 RepID=A0A6I6GR34_9PSED|nr:MULTISPECIES: hypothetical protein [Pseudomonas]HWD31993.1 hypothetical protein [Pseudomonas sp.]KJK09547.1 membrane protein [Pseudomonas sp. 5]MDD1976614.1 hypothetical protein [Pseudomonas putida]MDH2560766.1 hypothetical protein [Pseudomonas sp. Hg5Tf]PSS50142.1 hypothetical protein C6382_18350 [Pseudomonas sp. BBP2017]